MQNDIQQSDSASIRYLKHDNADVFSCMEELKYVITGYGTCE